MRLVVVESPTKARTIRRFLPESEYRIEACMGHVRDLPASAAEIPARYKGEAWAKLGVDVNSDFEPLYVTSPSKKKVVSELKKALKEADALYIATDEDREGESIGWHLLEVLKPRVPVKRMVFHEITREAIREALEHTRDVDPALVKSQETRRVLDRLVGYEISPLLWKKIAPKLSAGRVQSVAMRLLVLREIERIQFVAASYWDLEAALRHNGDGFKAQLTHLANDRLAIGKDFDENTGKLKEKSKAIILGEDKARELATSFESGTWKVRSVEHTTKKRRPYPPFITSTLQQEANRKLGLSARDTMRVAQKLYERGHITYMRTDSTHLSSEAIGASRDAIVRRYGKEYLSPSPRQFRNNPANAQEAHEAIRPAGTAMKSASDLHLSGRDAALYDLIWTRTMASQMADARVRFTTAIIDAEGSGGEKGTFRASGKRVEFAGFFRAYVEGSDDPDSALEDRDNPLPALQEGEAPGCDAVKPLGHSTKPPARYTDATLVQELEKFGIGRPSTYASIIGVIVERGYVRRKAKQLVPTFTAFATNNLLESQFGPLVDVDFTAKMEETLDAIAKGEVQATPYLKEFYFGDSGLQERVDSGLDKIDARAVSTVSFDKWKPYVVRVGRFGPYAELESNGERQTATIPDNVNPDELDADLFSSLLEVKQNAGEVLGVDPDSGNSIYYRKGRYGDYLQLGDGGGDEKPKRVSVPKGISRDQIDEATAIALIALPRLVGEHTETGKPVQAGIGRYGPFVHHDGTYANIKNSNPLYVLSIGLDEALALLSAKKTTSKALRVLGKHPETGKDISLLEGRYGPYVKHERTNASLPKGTDPEELTLEAAVTLLANKKSRKKTTRRRKK